MIDICELLLSGYLSLEAESFMKIIKPVLHALRPVLLRNACYRNNKLSLLDPCIPLGALGDVLGIFSIELCSPEVIRFFPYCISSISGSFQLLLYGIVIGFQLLIIPAIAVDRVCIGVQPIVDIIDALGQLV